MLKKYGSDQLKSSQYYIHCQFLGIRIKKNLFAYTLATSICTVAVFTKIFHFRRSLALSAAGPLRNILCKYLPAWLGFSLY